MDSADPAGEFQTTLSALKRFAGETPDALFLDFMGTEWSYRKFLDETTRLAHGLSAGGLEAGQTIASLLDNSVDGVLVWFAANMLGALHVPINTSYRGEFLRHQVADARAAILVVEACYADRVVPLEAQLPDLQLLIQRGDGRCDGFSRIVVRDFEAFRTRNLAPIDHEPKPSDIAAIVYTSGTSGHSKGCMLSHSFLCHTAREFNRFSGRRTDDHNWTALPLFHLNAIAGTVVATLLLGSSASLYPRFSLSAFWGEIERTRPRVVYLIGALTALIARMPDSPEMLRAKGIIRVVISAPCPPELQKIFQERFGVEHCGGSGFGQTEIGMPLTLPPGVEGKPNANGKSNGFFDVAILDEADRTLGPNEIGEIAVRPRYPGIMFSGYWGRPADTLAAMNNLWYHTGDLGKYDEDGFFYFLDRKKDYIRRRGENISSFEVERVFAAYPGIAEIAAHSVRSDLLDDEVKITVVAAAGARLDERSLCLWSVERLPHFAVPRFIEFRPELPKNPVGRVLKYLLRDQGVTATTWDREKAGITIAR